MNKGRKTNRDHTKKTQRPMVEDEVIASQLERNGAGTLRKLIVAPFPDRQRSPSEFFFQPLGETPLTIGSQP